MADKQNHGRFCVQFNLDDPRHRQVAELLERQGRRKAQFIVEAVLREGAPIMPDTAELKRLVEGYVNELMLKQSAGGAAETVCLSTVGRGTDPDLNASILNMMAALRA
jgi:hypothetical protein